MRNRKNAENPYPGLRPFEFNETHLFFGREGQSEELLRKLNQHSRFLAVVGTSGSGKSSLVRAGLLPLLCGGVMAAAGPRWQIALLRPGNDPIRNLAEALSRPYALERPAESSNGAQAPGQADPSLEMALLEMKLRRSALGLAEYARGLSRAAQNLLVVVDQFEEIFRFKEKSRKPHPEDEAAAFVKLLLEAAREEESHVYVVLTMRSDFLGDCAQFRDLPEAINDGQYLIPRMTREQLRLAVTAPAAVRGATLSRALEHRLLNDVGDNPDQLPILQHALMRTWDYWADGASGDGGREPATGAPPARDIEVEDYQAIGEMTQALSRHANAAFEELDERGREVAERVFKSLAETVTDNREIRRPTKLKDLCAVAEASREEVVEVIESFRRADRSFLVPPPDVPLTGESLIDISHESLIRSWDRLKEWVEEEAKWAEIYRRVANAAARHERGEAGLWRDPDLKFALDWRSRANPNKAWAQRYDPAFESAIAFLEASKRQQSAEAEERERLAAERRDRELREQQQEKELAEERARRAEEQAAARQRETEQAERLLAEQSQRAEEQTRAARRLRIAVILLIMTASVATGFAIYASEQSKRAMRGEAKAESNRQMAVASQMTAEQNAHEAVAERLKTEEALKVVQDERARADYLAAKEAARSKELDVALSKEKEATALAEGERKRADELAGIAEGERKKAVDLQGLAETRAAELQVAYESLEKKSEELEEAFKHDKLTREAVSEQDRGELTKAKESFKNISASYSNDPLKKAEEGWALYKLGTVYQQGGDYLIAGSTYTQALQLLKEAHGENSRELIGGFRGLAQVNMTRGNYSEAEKNFDALAKVSEDGMEPRDVTANQNRLMTERAGLYREWTRDADARLTAINRDLSQVEQQLGRDRNAKLEEREKDLRRLKADTDAEYQSSRRKAVSHNEELMKAQEDSLPPYHPDLAATYSEVAQFYKDTGDSDKADELEKVAQAIRALNKSRGSTGPNDWETYDLERLARSYNVARKNGQAVKVLNEAVSAETELTSGKDVSRQARLLVELGRSQERYEDSKQSYDRARTILEDAIAKNPQGAKDEQFALADVLSAAAYLEDWNGNGSESLRLREQSFAAEERLFGPNSLGIGHALAELGDSYLKQKMYDKARETFERLKRLWEDKTEIRKRGAPIPDGKISVEISPHNTYLVAAWNYIDGLRGLAAVYVNSNDSGRAEELYKQAEATFKWLDETPMHSTDDSFRESLSSVYARSLEGYADLLRKQNRVKEAEEKQSEADSLRSNARRRAGFN